MKLKNLNNFFTEFYKEKGREITLIDLHMHTTYSDGFITGRMLANFLRDKNYLISVTDHNAIGGNIILRKLGIDVVPGIELGCNDGFELLVYFKSEDDLIYFYTSYVRPNRNKYRMSKTTKDVFHYLKALENFECYISIPHIAGVAQKNFIKNKKYIYEVIKKVNAIEIHNDALPNSRNKIAKNLQKKYKKDLTFGSDAHFLTEVEKFCNLINQIKYKFDLLESLGKVKLLAGLGKKHLFYMIHRAIDK
ncbi:MAG: PHP domain-containing protein [Fusobacterium sp. JB019]|nr:PHP domain-containing protein [Fusobacterium sp. JB019]